MTTEQMRARIAKLERVAEAARSFFAQPYDNGQWETRLLDAVKALDASDSGGAGSEGT